MNSSSSDSDSDDLEPIRRIKINIKPKDTILTRDGADVEAIKASVEAWRPLGPRPHPTLSRRQSSFSSISSLGTTPNSTQGSSRTVSAVDTTSGSSNQNQFFNQTNFGTIKSNNMMMSNQATSSIRSSPSCSSLVNEFANRTSFTNFMPNASRTSSPLTFMNCNPSNLSETVPIALAIQESVELTVKGQHKSQFSGCDSRTQFETRALGNIKVAFPNNFARLCSLDDGTSKDQAARQIPTLKLRLHSTENIIRYYASGLVKDLDPEQSVDPLRNENNNNDNHFGNSNNTMMGAQRDSFKFDPFDMNESPTKVKQNSKIIEFNMVALIQQLKDQYERSPNMRYYNVDVLRYQIAPIDTFEKCPLQVCTYWKLEPKLIKLRLDFKHSHQSGFNLERLREISFAATLDNLVPQNLSIKPVLPNQVSSLLRASSVSSSNSADDYVYPNNRYKECSGTSISSGSSYSLLDNCNDHFSPSQSQSSTRPNESNIIDLLDLGPTHEKSSAIVNKQNQSSLLIQPQPAPRNVSSILHMRLPPPPSSGHSRHHRSELSPGSLRDVALETPPVPRIVPNSLSTQTSSPSSNSLMGVVNRPTNQIMDSNKSSAVGLANQQLLPSERTGTNAASSPYITFEPQANWDNQAKKLIWKFDNLLAFYKTDGAGSLLAKLDFRHCSSLPVEFMNEIAASGNMKQDNFTIPKPVDVKFMVVDSTLSKINLTIDSTGYRMSLLKKELRSGRYRSEACTF